MTKYLKYLLLLSALIVTNYTYAQHIFIGEEETNRKLNWSDFRGPVDHSSPHHAMTAWYMSYSMEEITSHGNEVKIGKLIVTLKMDQGKSWCIRDKVNDGLLKHEQGHFDIAILCMREFLSVFNQTTFHKNDIDSKMKKMFNDVMTKYRQLGIQYDKETEHSNNKDAQQFWNEFFEKYI